MITRYKHLVIQATDVSGGACDLAPVAALVDGPLPPDFAEFLCVAQGGLLSYELVVPGRKKNRVIAFHLILGLGTERSRHRPTTIVSWTKRARDSGAPASFILFGMQPLADLMLYFDVPPGGSGRVLLAAGDSGRFTTVAESFEQYVQALRLNHESILERLGMAYQNPDPRGLPEMLEWLDAAVPDWRARYEVPDDAFRAS